MDSSNSSIVSIALRALIANSLWKSLQSQNLLQLINSACSNQTETASTYCLTALFQTIPLNRIQSSTRLEYVSAFALKLAAAQQQTAFILAQEIKVNLREAVDLDQSNCFATQLSRELTVEITPPGWIYLRLSEAGTAEWLQCLVQALPTLKELEEVSRFTYSPLFNGFVEQQPNFFSILHAHARCCSLLRMAAEQLGKNFIQVVAPGSFAISQPLHWLELGQLRCREPQELALMAKICDALDFLAQSEALNSPSAKAGQLTYKTAERVSQAFQTFHAGCRIWGEVPFPLAQVRLGLVLITQLTLRLLLVRLNYRAPYQL